MGANQGARKTRLPSPLILQTAALIDPSEAGLSRVAAAAGKEASVDPYFLGGYLHDVLSAARAGGRLGKVQRDACRKMGEEAAHRGVSLAALLDLYLSAIWRLWRDIDARAEGTTLQALGTAAGIIFRAVDDAGEALAQGFEGAQRQAIRREEAFRREFVDDLLSGHGNVEDRARQFGFNLAAAHLVAVAVISRALADAGPVHTRLEAYVLTRVHGRDAIVATKGGRLVCVFPSTAFDLVDDLPRILEETGEGPWHVGLGRAYPGYGGLIRSYDEASEALDLAGRLGLDQSVVRFESMLPYRILVADPGASTEMVESVLGPLRSARGGARPLVETLEAYFAESMNVSATARRLHLSPRAVTYRLERVSKLTGYTLREPEQRFILELAVRGARLLGLD